jgi:hypothetical protein
MGDPVTGKNHGVLLEQVVTGQPAKERNRPSCCLEDAPDDRLAIVVQAGDCDDEGRAGELPAPPPADALPESKRCVLPPFEEGYTEEGRVKVKERADRGLFMERICVPPQGKDLPCGGTAEDRNTFRVYRGDKVRDTKSYGREDDPDGRAKGLDPPVVLHQPAGGCGRKTGDVRHRWLLFNDIFIAR